jgi:CheY-like chemotaxis protein/HPt (histidine-containing phosphotransfer) domain-containing protein
MDNNANRENTAAEQPADGDRDPLRILYADDDESSRLLVRKLLDGLPYELDLCENGSIAVDKCRNGGYDVVLMDMQMPVMDGATACRAIRARERERGAATTPIIALTGADSDEEIQAFREAGCTGSLRKPISRRALLASLGQYALRGPHAVPDGSVVDVRVARDLEDLIPGYLANRTADVVNLRKAAAEGDFDTVRILGHTMKGSGGGYGLERITEIGRHLEKAATNKNADECRKRIEELSEYLKHIRVTYT